MSLKEHLKAQESESKVISKQVDEIKSGQTGWNDK